MSYFNTTAYGISSCPSQGRVVCIKFVEKSMSYFNNTMYGIPSSSSPSSVFSNDKYLIIYNLYACSYENRSKSRVHTSKVVLYVYLINFLLSKVMRKVIHENKK